MVSKRPKPSSSFHKDDDEDYVPTKKVKYTESDMPPPSTEKKHTLDSDEEGDDELDENYKLHEDEIDGQEEATLTQEGETKITPFNMKEEMEEGHFDKEGFYHFNKDGNDIRDAWLDDVDWVKLKQTGEEDKEKDSDSDTEMKDIADIGKPEVDDSLSVYKNILEMMNEGESISRCLKRLTGNKKKLTTAERIKLKKAGKLEEATSGMNDFLKLTEYANKIMETGNMDIYEETYEMIALKIKRSEKPKSPVFDMFGEAENTSTTAAESSDAKDTFDQVMWEYTTQLTDSEEDTQEIKGPYTTQQMQKWKETDYFKDGVYVRKITEQSGPWYKSNRLDFEIYL